MPPLDAEPTYTTLSPATHVTARRDSLLTCALDLFLFTSLHLVAVCLLLVAGGPLSQQNRLAAEQQSSRGDDVSDRNEPDIAAAADDDDDDDYDYIRTGHRRTRYQLHFSQLIGDLDHLIN